MEAELLVVEIFQLLPVETQPLLRFQEPVPCIFAPAEILSAALLRNRTRGIVDLR